MYTQLPPRKLLNLFLIRYLRRPSQSLSTLVLFYTFSTKRLREESQTKNVPKSGKSPKSSALKIKKSKILNLDFLIRRGGVRIFSFFPNVILIILSYATNYFIFHSCYTNYNYSTSLPVSGQMQSQVLHKAAP